SGAARGVDDGDLLETRSQRALPRIGKLREARHVTRRGCFLNDLRQGRRRRALDQAVRRVERTTRLALVRLHQRLECLAEHLGIDGCLRELIALLARGEAISREE